MKHLLFLLIFTSFSLFSQTDTTVAVQQKNEDTLSIQNYGTSLFILLKGNDTIHVAGSMAQVEIPLLKSIRDFHPLYAMASSNFYYDPDFSNM